MESRRRLRSVTSSDLMVPATRRSTLGDCAFAVARPRAWNNLPDAIRHSPSLETFKRSLKSHLFLQCFLLSLSFIVYVWQLWLCTSPLKWLCIIYGTLQIDYFTLHYITYVESYIEIEAVVKSQIKCLLAISLPRLKKQHKGHLSLLNKRSQRTA